MVKRIIILLLFPLCAFAQSGFFATDATFMVLAKNGTTAATPYPGFTNGVAILYLFNGTPNDSAQSYNLTLNNSPSYGTGLNGGSGKALTLLSASLQYANNASLTNFTSFTIAAWYKPTDFLDYRCIVNFGDSATRNFEMDTRITTGKINVGFTQGALTYKELQSTAAISSGAFHFLVGTYDGTTLKIYIDGSLDSSTASFSGNPDAPTGHFTVGSILASGSFVPASFMNGTVQGLFIANRAITSTEVTTAYNSGLAVLQ